MKTSTPLQDIHQALASVFLRNGFAGASVARLASATGLGKASLYHHFPGGKEEMAATLIRNAVARLQQDVFSHLNGEGEPGELLQRVISAFAEYIERHGEQGCLIAQFALENAAPLDAEQVASVFNGWQRLISAQFEALGQKPKAADRSAQRLLAELYGQMMLARLRQDPKSFRRGLKRMRRDLVN